MRYEDNGAIAEYVGGGGGWSIDAYVGALAHIDTCAPGSIWGRPLYAQRLSFWRTGFAHPRRAWYTTPVVVADAATATVYLTDLQETYAVRYIRSDGAPI